MRHRLIFNPFLAPFLTMIFWQFLPIAFFNELILTENTMPKYNPAKISEVESTLYI